MADTRRQSDTASSARGCARNATSPDRDAHQGLLDGDRDGDELLANSINPEGVRAQEIIESLEEDVQEELGHARQFGERIKELYGVVPGSLDFNAEQSYLQPPDDQVDIVHVIKGVIEAESGAIEHYNQIIEYCEGKDPVTQDMVIAILHDEEGHRRLFEGFLREYQAEGKA